MLRGIIEIEKTDSEKAMNLIGQQGWGKLFINNLAVEGAISFAANHMDDNGNYNCSFEITDPTICGYQVQSRYGDSQINNEQLLKYAGNYYKLIDWTTDPEDTQFRQLPNTESVESLLRNPQSFGIDFINIMQDKLVGWWSVDLGTFEGDYEPGTTLAVRMVEDPNCLNAINTALSVFHKDECDQTRPRKGIKLVPRQEKEIDILTRMLREVAQDDYDAGHVNTPPIDWAQIESRFIEKYGKK